MKFIGAFFQFAGRVLTAAKRGGLSVIDQKKLDNLLTRTGKRNTVLAKGLLSALGTKGSSKGDVSELSDLLHKAETRMVQDKEPFTDTDRAKLSEIFQRAYLSDKVARWFSTQMDELLAEEINEFIEGKRRIDIGIPSKKTVAFNNETEHKREKKRKARA